jgi:hypothetical protein
MIEFHNPVMKMIEEKYMRKNYNQKFKKQKVNVMFTFIFSLHQFDQRLPNRVILLMMGLGLLSYS